MEILYYWLKINKNVGRTSEMSVTNVQKSSETCLHSKPCEVKALILHIFATPKPTQYEKKNNKLWANISSSCVSRVTMK
jgi:hypothetical protein